MGRRPGSAGNRDALVEPLREWGRHPGRRHDLQQCGAIRPFRREPDPDRLTDSHSAARGERLLYRSLLRRGDRRDGLRLSSDERHRHLQAERQPGAGDLVGIERLCGRRRSRGRVAAVPQRERGRRRLHLCRRFGQRQGGGLYSGRRFAGVLGLLWVAGGGCIAGRQPNPCGGHAQQRGRSVRQRRSHHQRAVWKLERRGDVARRRCANLRR